MLFWQNLINNPYYFYKKNLHQLPIQRSLTSVDLQDSWEAGSDVSTVYSVASSTSTGTSSRNKGKEIYFLECRKLQQKSYTKYLLCKYFAQYAF